MVPARQVIDPRGRAGTDAGTVREGKMLGPRCYDQTRKHTERNIHQPNLVKIVKYESTSPTL